MDHRKTTRPRKAPASDVEKRRLSAMRSINLASKSISTLVESGWKLKTFERGSAVKTASTLRSVNSSISTISRCLQELRKTCPEDIDVERAAVSVLGKLIALEMFDAALLELSRMHGHLCSLYHPSPPVKLKSLSKRLTVIDSLHLLSLPHPPPNQPIDSTILTVLSSYLHHAIASFSGCLFSSSTSNVAAFQPFSKALGETPSLLSWIPFLSSLPEAHKDSILIGIYTTLSKLSSPTPTQSAKAIYNLQSYALSCLLHTSVGTVEPDKLWSQATKFATTLVNNVTADASAKENATRTILSSYSSLVRIAEERDDRTFLTGKGFVSLCQYWTRFAKRGNDLGALDQIARLMQSVSTPSPATAVEVATSSLNQPVTRVKYTGNGDTLEKESTTSQSCENEQDLMILESARLCTTFAQATAVLDRFSSDPNSFNDDTLVQRVNQATTLIEQSLPRYLLHQPASTDGIGTAKRTASQIERALERLRRAAAKAIEATRSTSSINGEKEYITLLLVAIVNVLKGGFTSRPDTNTLTQALDTLFVLARTSLNLKSVQTYVPAYDFLAQAVTLLDFDDVAELASDSEQEVRANFVRCTSANFHNLASLLCQGELYGHAVRFLMQGCDLGERALRMHCRQGPANQEEAWVILAQQLYRRWELLGACYTKVGDRKLAFWAFTQSVKAFPASEFTTQTLIGGPNAVFDTSSSLKQLGMIIDKLTYLGSCELLLDPGSISLKTTMDTCTPAVAGIVLERQLDSLNGIVRKEGVRALGMQLLADAKSIYGEDMPVRRARILVKSLDLVYHKEAEPVTGIECPEDIGKEAEMLLTQANLRLDSNLAPFCPQYRALVHLWLALHLHRRTNGQQSTSVAHHAEEACKILRPVIATTFESEATLKPRKSPKHKVVAKKGLGKVSTVPRNEGGTNKVVRGVNRAPETPRKRTAMESLDVTPPRQSRELKKSLAVFDNFDGLLGLFQTVGSLLGLVGLVLPKILVLETIRQLCVRHYGVFHDGYLDASVELAHGYVKLGKMKKANSIYTQIQNGIRNGQASSEVRIRFFLRRAEHFAMDDNISRSSSVYCEALGLSNTLLDEDKRMSATQRVQARITRLARAAIASQVFAIIQNSKDDVATALDAMLQSLRLWNRAVDALTRLRPHKPTSEASDEPNPFEVPSTNDAKNSESSRSSPVPTSRTLKGRLPIDRQELWIAQGMLDTLFALCEAYFARGAAREAEYFAQQAQDFAESLNALGMVGRALARKGELQLHQGQLQEGEGSITMAVGVIQNTPSIDGADVRRLRGDYSQLCAQNKHAQELYAEATGMLEELDQHFGAFDDHSLRKSLAAVDPTTDVLVPALFATVLHQHIWLLRDDTGDHVKILVDRFMSLPPSLQKKAEETALMAKLELHNVYERFRGDMFLNSLIESTIALPMGMSGDKLLSLVPSMQDIMTTLDKAEKLFWADLELTAHRGKVSHVRDTVVSLALIRALQTSLGKAGKKGPVLAINLLDVSTSITLRREMLEAIEHKLTDVRTFDDLQWPSMTSNGSPLPRRKNGTPFGSWGLLDSDDDHNSLETSLKQYWESIRTKYRSQVVNASALSVSQVDILPANWTVVNIGVTEDKSTMFITRQRAGKEPLMFYLPLKGRRENDEDQHLTFDDALRELREIISLSDEGTRQAVNVMSDDPEGRTAWWNARIALDKRLETLLEDIEFCWLGAFKTILSQPTNMPADIMANLRAQFDKIFQRGLRSQEKKPKVPVRLHDTLLECFSSLSPKCRDEELEDLVYFVLDLYQFHGIAVATAEVDVDQVAVDMRIALEAHSARAKGKVVSEKDSHMFLVLDKNVQEIPWESIPILRGRNVSRIPSIEFLVDRIELAKRGKGRVVDAVENDDPVAAVHGLVDPRKTYYVLNPSGDLGRTEGRFAAWLKNMHKVGWKGLVGRPPSEQQFLDALRREDLVIYFGHGGGGQYVRSHKIRNLPRCAATMLWGCSSGALREMGDFDRVGTPNHYMLAGCPTLVANIWDVTDRDIDKFTQSVFDKMKLTVEDVSKWNGVGKRSLVEAVAQSRDCCKLKYLTGAAPVVYGIPFYL